MKLRHWSKYPIKKIKPVEELADENSYAKFGAKPHGFWVSDESKNAHGWRSWCIAENFRLDTFKYEYEVKLKPSARILYIKTAKELDEFTEKFRDENSGINKSIAHIGPKYGHKPDTMVIDWRRLARGYQGIVITPYISSRRLTGESSWYYPWDCASGCIWDTSAIAELKLITQHEVPRKKREINWEVQKRKLEKMMAKFEKERSKNERRNQAKAKDVV